MTRYYFFKHPRNSLPFTWTRKFISACRWSGHWDQ